MQQNRPQDHSPLSPADAAQLLQAAAVALMQLDSAGQVRWANDSALKALALQPGQAFASLWADPSAVCALCGSGALEPAAAELQAAHPSTPADTWFQAHSRPLPGGGWALTLLPLLPLADLRVAQAEPAQKVELLSVVKGDSEPYGLAATASELESQLSLAVELGGIVLWRHDLGTNRLHYNRHGWLAFGLEPCPEGLALAQVRALIHPEDLARVLASAEAALHSKQPVDVEARYRHADGGWHSQLLRRLVLRDAAGQPVAYLGVALDVTDRQQRRADAIGRRFEAVTRAAGIGHWILEPGQDFATWSEQLRTMVGLAPDEPVPAMRQWLDRFAHPDDLRRVKESTRRWLQSGEDSLELSFRVLRADGELRQFRSHSQLETGSDGPFRFGVVIDLTERHRFERALKGAQDRVALAARAAGLGTWEFDLGSGDTHWDEQMWLLRGHSPRPEPMNDAERLACLHPDDRSRADRLLRDAMATGSTFEQEFRVIWPDGSLHWLASRSMEIKDPDGSDRRMRIGVNWDITDSRTADTVRLEREIALRESASKSRFLARMSHELRTPLNAVLGFAQLLLADETATDTASPARRRRLEHIRSAGQHLLSLINDVLILSALEGGEMPITLEPVSLRALVEETLPMLAPLQQLHQAQPLRVELGALDLHVLADATRLRQVLLNLLSNALKYNRPAGSVHIEALRRGESVLLRVTDTGRGMTDEQLRHLFEPFNRLGADRGEIEGTGIGLAIVQALVERMGGSVHVDSRPGEGSVFELRLAAASMPQAEAKAVPTAVPPATVNPPLAPARLHRVLYIEDNPVNALIISELLALRSDLALDIAVDGSSGVSQAQALRPDLILLDMQLPDFDGFEVLRRLREQPDTAGIPCIALSANAMPADIKRALQAGMSDYWTKPLDFKAFMAALEQRFGSAP